MTICLSATRSSGPCVLTVYPRSARQPLQLRKRFGPFSGLRSPALLPVSFAILALRVSAIYSVPCLLQAHCIPIAALIPQAMFAYACCPAAVLRRSIGLHHRVKPIRAPAVQALLGQLLGLQLAPAVGGDVVQHVRQLSFQVVVVRDVDAALEELVPQDPAQLRPQVDELVLTDGAARHVEPVDLLPAQLDQAVVRTGSQAAGDVDEVRAVLIAQRLHCPSGGRHGVVPMEDARLAVPVAVALVDD